MAKNKRAMKFTRRVMAEDPEYFKKLAARRKTPTGGRNSTGSFKPGNSFASMGGKASKRGPSRKRGSIDKIDIVENTNLVIGGKNDEKTEY